MSSACTALAPCDLMSFARFEVACLKEDATCAAREELQRNPRVGAYANRRLWTDVDPYEIVRVVSDRCLEVRAMETEPDLTWQREVIPGGFTGHTTNNHEQRWVYRRCPEGQTLRIRKHKNGQWYDAHGDRYSIAAQPVKHYDFNF